MHRARQLELPPITESKYSMTELTCSPGADRITGKTGNDSLEINSADG